VIETEAEDARCEPGGTLPARRVVVLGSTGSIGRQALEVIAAVPALGIAALVANTNVAAVLEQAQRLGVGRVGLHDVGAAAEAAARRRSSRLYAGGGGGGGGGAPGAGPPPPPPRAAAPAAFTPATPASPS
jgi:1-deoxy-D-xylulose-5-phosphate reductoisomerase